MTSDDGTYSFTDLPSGTYSIEERQPSFVDGDESVGSCGGDIGDDLFTNITVDSDVDCTGYDFGELSIIPLSKRLLLASTPPPEVYFREYNALDADTAEDAACIRDACIPSVVSAADASSESAFGPLASGGGEGEAPPAADQAFDVSSAPASVTRAKMPTEPAVAVDRPNPLANSRDEFVEQVTSLIAEEDAEGEFEFFDAIDSNFEDDVSWFAESLV